MAFLPDKESFSGGLRKEWLDLIEEKRPIIYEEIFHLFIDFL